MRILFVTQYYLPETGAPQNRLSGLARELVANGVEVEVLTAMPNYPRTEIYEGYRKKFSLLEIVEGIKVNRAWIFTSKNRNIFFRLLNYFSFVFTSWIVSFKIKSSFDFVLCESPPLFLGMSAFLIAKRKRAKFIFNVSDLWPESAEKLGLVSNKTFLNIAYKLEASLYRKSALVTGQTRGICSDINNRFPFVKTYWLPNGIDAERFDPSVISKWRKDNSFDSGDFILLYAGIIGHAQGLEIIIECAELLRNQSSVKFILLGDGPVKAKLQEMVSARKLNNVFFIDSVSRDVMPSILASCNAAVIPLRKLGLFKGAIPSKIFETLAMKKPILLGVEGEAKDIFIDEGNCGIAFEPENPQSLADAIILLMNDPKLVNGFGENGFLFVHEFFNRKKISEGLLTELRMLK